MTGFGLIALISGLVVVMTVGFNISLWLRHKSMAAARGDWSEASFVAQMCLRGIDADLAASVTRHLEPFYYANCVCRAEDRLVEDLKLEADDIAELVEQITIELRQPQPDRSSPEEIPPLETVGDLAHYLAGRSSTPKASVGAGKVGLDQL